MFEIIIKKDIQASVDVVWSVITKTVDYAQWNDFVPVCDSSFKVGSPIVMKVRLLPFFALRQKETIFANQALQLLEYGVSIPLLLSSSRQHRLMPSGDDDTAYESHFRLQGLLAPLVALLLGRRLQQGFNSMTEGLVSFSEKKAAAL